MNYSSISFCAARGNESARRGDETAAPADWLGADADWSQRRAFEWGFLWQHFNASGDTDRAAYCHGRIQQLKQSLGY